MSWHPDDPRGWAAHNPRWNSHRPGWGWGAGRRPLYDNQLGHRLPSGGPPAPGQLSIWLALTLFVLSPLTLLAWVAGQALLRATGLRWWKLALASLGALVLVIAVQGGVGPALAHHFSGYLWVLRQYGQPTIHLPVPGAFLWPQIPLSLPIGLLAAALNVARRPRQAIDPAAVKRTSATPPSAWPLRSAAPLRSATTTGASPPLALPSTATSAGPTATASWSSPHACRLVPG